MGIASVGCASGCAAPTPPPAPTAAATATGLGGANGATTSTTFQGTAPADTAATDRYLDAVIGGKAAQLATQSPVQAGPGQLGPGVQIVAPGGPVGTEDTLAEDARLNRVFGTQYNFANNSLLTPVGRGPVASSAAVDQMFSAASRLTAADPTTAAALDRLRPYASQLDAATVNEIDQMLASGSAQFGTQEAALAFTQLYIDAATRTGKYTQGAGVAITALLKEQRLQRQRIADLSIAIANYTNATGQINQPALAKLQELNTNTAELSQLGVALSQVSDKLPPQAANDIALAINQYNQTGDFNAVRNAVSATVARFS